MDLGSPAGRQPGKQAMDLRVVISAADLEREPPIGGKESIDRFHETAINRSGLNRVRIGPP